MGAWGADKLWNNPIAFINDQKSWIAIVAAISIVITAAYIIRMIRRVFFGDLPKELEGHIHDVTVSEKIALGLSSAVLVGIGVFPSIMVPMMDSGVQHVLTLLGG